MSELLNINKDYRAWVETIKKRYKQSQIRAVLKANQEMMSFYWQLGKDIVEMRVEEQWGKKYSRICHKICNALCLMLLVLARPHWDI